MQRGIKMKSMLLRTTLGIVGLFTLVGCTQLFVSGQPQVSTVLEGVWRTSVTPRNCQTGQPLPVPPFPGILAFERGGTITGTSTAVTSVYGTWQREPGQDSYSFRTLSFRYDASGALQGTRVISQNVTLGPNKEMTTDGEFKDYDATGALVASGCSTATGTRF